ncbi:MAG: hypothetical protein P8P32_05490 [Akkermansiaceae bacterium]|nr:hypothetical protein [Akkermansiaceae bacterium]MDG2322403.1 hypothetical protein [Akkermansiaceae bacterium]
MISLKNLAGLLLSGALLVSCTPAYPPGHNPNMPAGNLVLGPNQPYEKTIAQLEIELAERKAEEKRRIEARERSIEEAARDLVAQDTPPVINPATTSDQTPLGETNTNRKKTYQTARKIPGKSGYVFNPWTMEPVDVRGIPSGSLVQDPNDPNKSIHRFRVP